MADCDQAVLIRIRLSDDSFGMEGERSRIVALEAEIERTLEKAAAGELDGDEFGEGQCTIYLYGSDADQLADVVLPLLANFKVLPGSSVTKRYGPPGSREEQLLVYSPQ